MTDDQSFPDVRLEITGSVASVVLDRPTVMNAISAVPGGTRDQILAAIATAEADPSIGCILLRAEGANFSSGGDLTANANRETEAEHRAFLETADAFHRALRIGRLPIVAAVQGFCLGAAVALVDSCDLVVLADDAKLGFPEGRLGLVGASAVVETVGRQWAKFLIMTGELIDASRAVELGLGLVVVPAAELAPRSHDLADRIARMPREAVRLNRRTVDAVADAGDHSAAREAAIDGDTATLLAADRATAPDGRSFRAIIDEEGMAGMKAARDAQYTDPWLT